MEIDRLRELRGIEISEEVALKLKMVSPATIDRKLKHQREFLHLSRSRCGLKPGYLLKQKIPIKLTEWDTRVVGYVEMDSFQLERDGFRQWVRIYQPNLV